jgi:hypothetical protein
MGVGSDGSAAVALMVRWRALWCARGGPAAALVREVGRRHLIGDIRLLSDEGTEYVGRGTTHKKGTPQGTGGPTRSSSIRSGAHRRTTHARRRPQGASGRGRPRERSDLGRRALARTFWCAPVRLCFSQKFSTKVR